jgi:hypothetical protein
MTGHDAVREQEIAETRQIRSIARQVARIAQDRQRRLDLTLLALGVFTGGSLWVAILRNFEPMAVWLGAIASTAVALQAGYSRLRNYLKLSLEALLIQEKTTDLLIRYTKNPLMPRSEYRAEMKKLEDAASKLRDGSGFRGMVNPRDDA